MKITQNIIERVREDGYYYARKYLYTYSTALCDGEPIEMIERCPCWAFVGANGDRTYAITGRPQVVYECRVSR